MKEKSDVQKTPGTESFFKGFLTQHDLKSLAQNKWLSLVLIAAPAFILVACNSSDKTNQMNNADTTNGLQKSEIVPATTNPASSSTLPADSIDSTHGQSVELVSKGAELLSQGKVDEAIKSFQSALAIDSEDENAHYNMGIALARAGRMDEAIQHYREALKIVPNYSEVHNNLGNLLARKGQLDESITHFKAALEVNPANPVTHNNLGTSYAKQNKVAEAIVSFSEAVRLDPDYFEARFNLAGAYSARGRWSEAADEYREALRIRPDFNPAIQGLNKALLKAK